MGIKVILLVVAAALIFDGSEASWARHAWSGVKHAASSVGKVALKGAKAAGQYAMEHPETVAKLGSMALGDDYFEQLQHLRENDEERYTETMDSLREALMEDMDEDEAEQETYALDTFLESQALKAMNDELYEDDADYFDDEQQFDDME